MSALTPGVSSGNCRGSLCKYCFSQQSGIQMHWSLKFCNDTMDGRMIWEIYYALTDDLPSGNCRRISPWWLFLSAIRQTVTVDTEFLQLSTGHCAHLGITLCPVSRSPIWELHWDLSLITVSLTICYSVTVDNKILQLSTDQSANLGNSVWSDWWCLIWELQEISLGLLFLSAICQTLTVDTEFLQLS